jgi:hypothetical protein
MSGNHTPGPWEAFRVGSFWSVIEKKHGICLADTVMSSNSEANARLMAASHELLVALERLVSAVRLSDAYDEIAEAEKAIKKARGE